MQDECVSMYNYAKEKDSRGDRDRERERKLDLVIQDNYGREVSNQQCVCV